MLRVQKAKSSRESIPLLRITSILIVVFICWKGKVIRVKLAQPLYACQVKGFLWPSPSRSYKLSVFSTTLLCRSSKRLLWPCLTHTHLCFVHYWQRFFLHYRLQEEEEKKKNRICPDFPAKTSGIWLSPQYDLHTFHTLLPFLGSTCSHHTLLYILHMRYMKGQREEFNNKHRVFFSM